MTYLSWFEDKEVTNFLNSRNLTREKVIEYIEFGINLEPITSMQFV